MNFSWIGSEIGMPQSVLIILNILINILAAARGWMR